MRHKRALSILDNVVTQLRELRLEKGISHDTLAKAAGISRPAVSHIENRRRKPTLLMALKLAGALGIELSSVLSKAERAQKD
jgi:transcriptional regulator with XRE-family HTH domain